MKKAFSISKKDIIILLNDPAALVFMLLAPFLLTLGLGAVSGSFTQSSNSSGIADVPVVIVNKDRGDLGQVMVDVFFSEDLFAAQEMKDEQAARKLVDDDSIAAVVLIPENFSASMLDADPPEAPVEVYSNPSRPISNSIVRSVVSSVISQVEIAPVSIQVTIDQLVENGFLNPQDVPQAVDRISAAVDQGSIPMLISVNQSEVGTSENSTFSAMGYLAPGMAIFFLMYTVTQGARSILAEREFGTMSRMLSTPTSSGSILGGKLLGIFIAGFGQVLILVLVSAGIFQLDWGQPLAVILLVAATVLGATGWGLLIAAFSRQSWQVSSFGTALMLLFGILGGSFIPVNNFNDFMRILSKITPHAWASDAFLSLSTGGDMATILPNIIALLVMALVLFGASAIIARKRWVE